MLFSSSIFLFLFLPIVLVLYYISPKRLKNLVLLIASLFFYSWGEQAMVLVMLLTIFVDFTAAQLIEKGSRKFGLLMSIISNVSLLGFFKYFNFAFENFHNLIRFIGLDHPKLHSIPHVTLPIGISFYIFQSLSYTIDVYRGQTKANKNIIDFAAFVTMFPQLIAGPIVRYADLAQQLKKKNISQENFAVGIQRFTIGLCKKMLIANACAAVADATFETPVDELSTGWAWIGIFSYAFQIYFDFSGYSDMAIGLGKMFGFDFLENFNYPYISQSIREFWQRWHISLSSWFRDYVYIPLGGSRVAPPKVFRNLFIVFFITGLWHGASWNFIVWGLFHGFFIVLERMGLNNILQKVRPFFRYTYTLMVVLFGWVFFRAESLFAGLQYIEKMLTFSSGDPARVSYLSFFYLNSEFFVICVVAILWSTPVVERAVAYVSRVPQIKPIVIWIEPLVLLILFVVAASYVAADTYNPFIYFRF